MKAFFSFTILCLLLISANAQIRLGLRFAPQLTWASVDNKNVTSSASQVNAAYGLMLNYQFTDNYAFGTELCFNSFTTNLVLPKSRFAYIQDNLGHQYTNKDDLKYEYKLNYLQVPVLLKMQMNEMGAFRGYAEFGFNFGFLIRAKADVTMDTLSLSNVNINSPDDDDRFSIFNTKYSDHVNTIRTSLVIGAGVLYKISGTTQLVIGVRYDNGFSSFTSDDRWSTSLNYLALNCGILF